MGRRIPTSYRPRCLPASPRSVTARCSALRSSSRPRAAADPDSASAVRGSQGGLIARCGRIWQAAGGEGAGGAIPVGGVRIVVAGALYPAPIG